MRVKVSKVIIFLEYLATYYFWTTLKTTNNHGAIASAERLHMPVKQIKKVN